MAGCLRSNDICSQSFCPRRWARTGNRAPLHALHHHSVQYTGDAKLTHPSRLLGNFDSGYWRRSIGSSEQLPHYRSPLGSQPFRETLDVDTIDTRAPLLDLTFFHASVILALDTWYPTDTSSTGGDSMTRQHSNPRSGLTSDLRSCAPPYHAALGPFPRTLYGFSSSADFCHVNAHLRRLCSTTSF